ncbi:hypothetical protein [Cupriavidus basilensis]|uniref:hypothetical protein n=1 Tax=Cupriavidus basilensis TaxID=68895 RepID=UPI0039F6E1CB
MLKLREKIVHPFLRPRLVVCMAMAIALSACGDQKASHENDIDTPLRAFVKEHAQLCATVGPTDDTWPIEIDARFFTNNIWRQNTNLPDRLSALAAAGLIRYANGPKQGFRTYTLTDLGIQKLRRYVPPRPGLEAKGDEGQLCFGSQEYRGIVSSEAAGQDMGFPLMNVKYKVEVSVDTWAQRQDVQSAFKKIRSYGVGGAREESIRLFRRQDGWIVE